MNRFRIFVLSMLTLLTAGMVLLLIDRGKVSDTLPTNTGTNKVIVTNEEGGVIKEYVVEENDEELKASISGLLKRIEKLEEDVDSPVATTIPVQTQNLFQTQVIYLGSANTKKHEWTESGVEVTLNSSDYPSHVSVVFQAGLDIVGGEVWARLVNKTTGAIISITEVFHNTNTTTWKGSPSFKLYGGNNVYVVEMRSTSGETANMSGARLIISPN